VFERSQKDAQGEDYCFSIICKTRTFDFECESEEDRDYISRGLKGLVTKMYADLGD
jgi:hypothetical protein